MASEHTTTEGGIGDSGIRSPQSSLAVPAPFKSKFTGIAVAGFVAFGGVIVGYDTEIFTGVHSMKDWSHAFSNQDLYGSRSSSTASESLIFWILWAGAFFGALFAAPMGDFLGRKWGLVAACFTFCIGVAIQTGTLNFVGFVVGRGLAGFGVGVISCLIPMFQSECSTKRIRGTVVSCYQLAITIGQLLGVVVANATRHLNGHSAWRIPIAVQLFWAAVFASGMVLLPESPYYLIKCGRDQQARHTLARLLSMYPEDPEVETRLNEILTDLRAENEFGSGSYVDCFRQGPNKNRTRVMAGILLQMFQQLTCINFAFYYGTVCFHDLGIDLFLASVVVNAVNVGATILGIYLINKVGRRSLLGFGVLGMIFFNTAITIAGLWEDSQIRQTVLAVLICICIVFFATTWGPIAWVTIGEIFPLAIRAKAMSISVALGWLSNFGVTYATPYLFYLGRRFNHEAVTFLAPLVMCCVSGFLLSLVPEAKGLSLEEINKLYRDTEIQEDGDSETIA